MPLPIVICEDIRYDLAIFQAFCNEEIFVKANLPVFCMLIQTREKSQKYLDLSPFR